MPALAAVAMFGRSYLARGDKEAAAICLERGACAPWAHEHTASWFISNVLRRAHADHGWKIFIAYADPDAGEVGTVYQACNWLYLGQTPGRLVGGKPRPRDYFRLPYWPEGKAIEDRAWRKQGHILSDTDFGWERVRRSAKHKYVAVVCDTARERRELMRRFDPLPYPKRSSAA